MSVGKINMIGGGFQHEICSSAGHKPKEMEWVKDGSAPLSIHIDHTIFNTRWIRIKRIMLGWQNLKLSIRVSMRNVKHK